MNFHLKNNLSNLYQIKIILSISFWLIVTNLFSQNQTGASSWDRKYPSIIKEELNAIEFQDRKEIDALISKWQNNKSNELTG